MEGRTRDSWDTDQSIWVTSVVRARRGARIQRVTETVEAEARMQRVTETVEAERQNKLSLDSAKSLLFLILCLHWKSASSTPTLIPINVPL